jgi:isopentenyl-diphosphate delta-isomerase type 1
VIAYQAFPCEKRRPLRITSQPSRRKRESVAESVASQQLGPTRAAMDPEQVRLLEEEVILVDRDDTPIGRASKKECETQTRPGFRARRQLPECVCEPRPSCARAAHLTVNINKGMLHRAFSVFLFNEEGKLLLQKRSDAKITFPSRWTNTCCSHPLYFPEEMDETNNIGEQSVTSARARLRPRHLAPERKWRERTPTNSSRDGAFTGVKRAASRKLEHELGITRDVLSLDDFRYITRLHYLATEGMWGEHEGARLRRPRSARSRAPLAIGALTARPLSCAQSTISSSFARTSSTSSTRTRLASACGSRSRSSRT